jgi:hypothetical protein
MTKLNFALMSILCSLCLLQTISILTYLNGEIVGQTLINIAPHLSSVMVTSCNMRFLG